MRGKYYSLILILMLFIFLPGCGGSADDLAPFDGVITINPDSVDVTDGGTVLQSHTQLFTISVTDKDGIPVGPIKLNISYMWATPDPYGAVQLYDGNTPQDSPMNVYTDDYGVYNLRVDFTSGEGREYTADVEVRSGSVYDSATISVAGGGA